MYIYIDKKLAMYPHQQYVASNSNANCGGNNRPPPPPPPGHGYNYPPQNHPPPPPPQPYGGNPYPPQPSYNNAPSYANYSSPTTPSTTSGIYTAQGEAGSANPNTDTMYYFRSIDTDGAGCIDAIKLSLALSPQGTRFSLATTEKLIAMYDVTYSGCIYPENFRELHEFIMTMFRGFKERDLSGDGRLDGNEIRMALRSRNLTVDENTFQAMMRKFDRHKRGSLGFDDYVELSLYLSKARRVFGTHDPQGKGQAVLSFDNFIISTLEFI